MAKLEATLHGNFSAILNAIDTALQELIQDGTVEEILSKYITAE